MANHNGAYDVTVVDLYSPAQQVVLTVLPMFPSALSIICSMLIIHVIWLKRKQQLKTIYHRYMFVMSILDVISSTNSMVAAFMVPKGTPDVFWASGNTATCDASGFLGQFGFVIPIYSACLSFYWLLHVRYQVKDRVYSKFVEPFVHLLCISYTLLSGSLGLVWQVFNPSQSATGWCVASPYPWGCADDPSIDCTRGEKYSLFGFIFFSPMVLLVLGSLVFNMVMLYCTVRTQEKRMDRYGTFREMKLSQKVGRRAIRFVGAFLFTFFWPSVVHSILFEVDGPERFILLLMLKCFLPLQGFWNFLIYIGPRKQDLTDAYASSMFPTASSRSNDAPVSTDFPEVG